MESEISSTALQFNMVTLEIGSSKNILTTSLYNINDIQETTKSPAHYTESLNLVDNVNHAVYKFCYMTMLCIGLFSNAIILTTLLKNSKFKFSTDVYLTFLAVFDNCSLLVALLEVTIFYDVMVETYSMGTLNPIGYDDISCKIFYIVRYSMNSFPCISIYILTATTVDRCWVLINPFKPKPTRKHAIICVCIIIVCEMGFYISGSTMIGIMYVKSVDMSPTNQAWGTVRICEQNMDKHSIGSSFILLEFILNVIIPLITIIVANSILIYRLKKQETQIHPSDIQSNTVKEKRITRKIISVNCFYVLCILPSTIYFTAAPIWLGNLDQVYDLRKKLGLSALYLATANYSFNLYIYILNSSEFRGNVKKAFYSIFCKN